MSNCLSSRILPMRNGFQVCWVLGSSLTLPPGASNSMLLLKASRTLSTSVLHDVGVLQVAQRRVLLRHRLQALGLQVLDDDQVGRAREDVVRAEQVELLLLAALLAHEPLDGGQDLLVRGRPGVDDVLGALV